jgi:sec-independent protein translocase protein TatC
MSPTTEPPGKSPSGEKAQTGDPPKSSPENHKMPLLDHLIELRNRLLYSIGFLVLAVLVSYYFAEDIFAFLVRPLAQIYEGEEGRRLIYTGLTEAFFTYLKVAFFAGVFVSFPLIAAQLWMFVAPGLYRNEKRVFLPFLVATPLLFLLGGALAYYVIFPLAWPFFTSFEAPAGIGTLPIVLEPKVNEYLSLVMKLIFAFGVSFELPVLLVLMARVGLISARGLRRNRKYAIVLTFIAAAVLTPPDVISQVSLGVPILLLYEISIFAVRLVEKRRAATEDGASHVRP